MTLTRRQVLSGAVALGSAAAAAACRGDTKPAASKARPPAPTGTLYARIGDTLSAVALPAGKPANRYPGAVPDAGWQRLHWRDGAGSIRIADAATGRELHRITAPDGAIKAAAATLPLLALGPGGGRRARTELTVVTPDGTRPLSLPGTVEPEAFSGDGTTMYVLDHLRHGYRVRMVDLAGGRMTPLLTREKAPVPAEEQMRGRYQQSVLAPGRNVLYSLYTHQADHLHTRDLVGARDSAPGVHAFVHVLQLDERWAYCLDLPEQMGRGEPAGHCLTLSPDGGQLYVFDSGSRTVVAADTRELRITTTRRLDTAPAPSYALAVGDDLVLAAGLRAHRLSGAGLEPRADWALPGPAAGLAAHGGELLAGVAGQVLRLDPETGSPQGTLRVPGLREVLYAFPAG